MQEELDHGDAAAGEMPLETADVLEALLPDVLPPPFPPPLAGEG
jgi:hypothetical protein